MDAQLKALYDQKGSVVQRMQELGDKVKNGSKPKLDDEDIRQLKAWDEELKGFDAQIEARQIIARNEAQAIVREENSITKKEEAGKKEIRFANGTPEQRMSAWNKANKHGISTLDEEERSIYNTVDRDNKVYGKWLRRGHNGLNVEERQILQTRHDDIESRALSHTNDATGAYTIPEGFSGYIIERMLFISELLGYANIVNTATGNPIPFPTGDDTANVGELLAENTPAGNQDQSFGVINSVGHTFSSKYMLVPNQLLQDNGVNLEEYIGKTFANRVARIENTYYTTGTGSGQPQGYVAGASAGITTAAEKTFTAAELMALEHSLNPAYRNAGAVFAMNDAALLAIKQLSVTTNPIKPIWLASLSQGQPNTILGYRYFSNSAMASSIVADSIPIVFGDFKEFMIRKVNGFSLQRLTELYAISYQTAFVGFSRSDSRVMQPQALKKMTMANT